MTYAEVIGDPIAHSKSPLIHGFWLRKLGIEADYRATRVTGDGLADYFAARRVDPDWRGCNITMPHKMAALEFTPHETDPSFPILPINIAIPHHSKGLAGHNSDMFGFFEPLVALTGITAEPGASGPAIVIGTGGAARALWWGLLACGFGPTWFVTRNVARAAPTMKEFSALGARALALGDALPEAALLVNASPLGMTGMPPLDIALDSLRDDAIVFDMVYNPRETPLLIEAKRRGLRTIDGLQMLIAQAAISFGHFFKAAPPRAFDWELRELLTS